MKEEKSLYKTYLGLLIVGIILGILFFRSAVIGPWTLHKHKVRILLVEIILVIILPIFLSLSEKVRNWLETSSQRIKRFFVNHKKNCISALAKFVITTVLCIVLHFVVNKVLKVETGKAGLATCLSGFYVGVLLYSFRNTIWKRIEIVFAAVAFIVGLYFIFVVTPLTGISWDDQIHYWNTLSLTEKVDGYMSNADDIMVMSAYDISHSERGLHKDQWVNFVGEMNQKYESRERAQTGPSGWAINRVAYIPSALGILFGRSIGLNWNHIFDMGKLFNLLMYIGLFTLAIKRVKYGKLFIAIIGLIPTSLFMACSYSYDPWLIAWTTLGLAYFVSMLQSPNHYLEMKEYLIMLLVFMIGCMPKAVYFPMILPALCIPSSRFKYKKQAFLVRASVLAVFVLLIASFMIPIIRAGGFGGGDIRGGSAVNSTLQVQYILSHPLEASRTFLKFSRDYILLDTDNVETNFTTEMAYLGTGKGWAWVMMLLLTVGILDREEKSLANWKIRLTGLVGCACTVLLIVLALYISFTAVGSESVAGVQNRYLLPLIFPAFYFLGTPGNRINREKSETAILPIGFMAYMFIYTVYRLCIA